MSEELDGTPSMDGAVVLVAGASRGVGRCATPAGWTCS